MINLLFVSTFYQYINISYFNLFLILIFNLLIDADHLIYGVYLYPNQVSVLITSLKIGGLYDLLSDLKYPDFPKYHFFCIMGFSIVTLIVFPLEFSIPCLICYFGHFVCDLMYLVANGDVLV